MATIQECNRALKRLPEFARLESQQAIDTTAFHVSRSAARRARVLTGRLQKAIAWKSMPRSVSAIVGVDPEAFYWKFQEYGTVKMGAHPMFRPAAEEMAADHDRRMISGLERALSRMEREAR